MFWPTPATILITHPLSLFPALNSALSYTQSILGGLKPSKHIYDLVVCTGSFLCLKFSALDKLAIPFFTPFKSQMLYLQYTPLSHTPPPNFLVSWPILLYYSEFYYFLTCLLIECLFSKNKRSMQARTLFPAVYNPKLLRISDMKKALYKSLEWLRRNLHVFFLPQNLTHDMFPNTFYH